MIPHSNVLTSQLFGNYGHHHHVYYSHSNGDDAALNQMEADDSGSIYSSGSVTPWKCS